MSAVAILFVALGLFTAYLLVVMVVATRRAAAEGENIKPTVGATATGFVANFFDTLGIGSFAPTTTMFRSFRMVPDERIPGTLNAGYAIAALFQSFLFIGAVEVEPKTLVLMIGAAVLGAWAGAGVFSKWPKRYIQWGMGGALLIAGTLFIYKNLKGDPVGGMLIGLTGTQLVLGLIGNFVLGVLMTIGVGLYGPCMLLVTMLGMNPKTAFPIMMGSCAFLMPIASARFLKEKAVDMRVALALTLSSIPAVWLAYKFFSNLDIAKIRWLVAIVVLYTGVMLLRSALRGRDDGSAADAVAAKTK
ncbi:MAG: sulfite exporter TauE/SafE family protein [Gemmatimonas sp.]